MLKKMWHQKSQKEQSAPGNSSSLKLEQNVVWLLVWLVILVNTLFFSVTASLRTAALRTHPLSMLLISLFRLCNQHREGWAAVWLESFTCHPKTSTGKWNRQQHEEEEMKQASLSILSWNFKNVHQRAEAEAELEKERTDRKEIEAAGAT